MVEAEALQAGGDLIHDVAARQPDRVRPRPHAAAHLGRDDHVLALHAEIAQRLPELDLRLALRIDVGGVDEIDAGLERAADERGRARLVDRADRAPEARRRRRSSCRGRSRRQTGRCGRAVDSAFGRPFVFSRAANRQTAAGANRGSVNGRKLQAAVQRCECLVDSEMSCGDGADHQQDNEKDETDHAAPPVADARRNEHKAPEQERQRSHGGDCNFLSARAGAEASELQGAPMRSCAASPKEHKGPPRRVGTLPKIGGGRSPARSRPRISSRRLPPLSRRAGDPKHFGNSRHSFFSTKPTPAACKRSM